MLKPIKTPGAISQAVGGAKSSAGRENWRFPRGQPREFPESAKFPGSTARGRCRAEDSRRDRSGDGERRQFLHLRGHRRTPPDRPIGRSRAQAFTDRNAPATPRRQAWIDFVNGLKSQADIVIHTDLIGTTSKLSDAPERIRTSQPLTMQSIPTTTLDPSRPDTSEFFLPGSGLSALLIHGLTGTPYEMRYLGERLAARGVRVLGVRLRAMPVRPKNSARPAFTTGTKAWSTDSRSLRQYGDPIVVVGLSMGAVLAARLARISARRWRDS